MKDIVIFDLDGTLSESGEFVHYIIPPNEDWDSWWATIGLHNVYQDAAAVFRSLLIDGYEIWIVTARHEEVRPATEAWLIKHDLVPDRLIMRPDFDRTNDFDWKVSLLDDGTIPKERILFVLEDRTRCVKAWREAGVPCFQVRPGDY